MTNRAWFRPALKIDTYWEHVYPDPNTGCWLWGGSTLASGYGRIGQLRAHRFAFEEFVGPIPEGQIVRHSCDTPCCVNPGHLVAGTDADNARDKVARGRTLRGSRAPNVKLTPTQVLQIRAIGYERSAREVAEDFGVSRGCVEKVRIGSAWKHLPKSREAALAKLAESLEEI